MTDSRFDDCVGLIRGGDKNGLKEIYCEYGKMIFSVMNTAVGNPHNAEDLTADFFLKLWNISASYSGGNGHKRWLVTVARNMAADFLRKSGRELLTVDDENEDGLTANEPADFDTPEEKVLGRLSVSEALEQLDASEREILNLKVYAELTFAEISEVLKKPVGTVAWKYRNTVAKLQKLIKEVRK